MQPRPTASTPPARHLKARRALVVVILLAALASGGLLAANLAGARQPPAAAAANAVGTGSPPPVMAIASPTSPASPEPTPSATPIATPAPTLAPTPTPTAGPVDINLAPDAGSVFSSQITKEWCAAAGMTSALATMGLVEASDAVQREIESRIGSWTSHADSLNGGWGPLAMTKALAAYGAPGYVVVAYRTRDAALRAAGIALSATREPVILLAWWGAHTWVMTGYRATGDLASNPSATFVGAYIVDPWYPRVSSIWGRVKPPGHFYDLAGLKRNYIAWTRPEGRYPGRDGRWIAVIPTLPLVHHRSLPGRRPEPWTG
jgi:hypothetical protein